MKLDETSPLPLYAQIEAAITEQIGSGKFAVGEKLPSEDVLVSQFQVSRTTIRTAVQNLVNRSILEIRRGRGTFVCEKKITQELTELTGFVEDMTSLGMKASTRVLEKGVVKANAAVAAALNLQLDEEVVRIVRIRLGDGIALAFDETYLPIEVGQKILSNDLESEPIFSLLEKKYDVPLISADYILEAIVADPLVAEALNVEQGSPIFLIERTSCTTDGKPVDYEKLHYRADKIRFQTQLRRTLR